MLYFKTKKSPSLSGQHRLTSEVPDHLMSGEHNVSYVREFLSFLFYKMDNIMLQCIERIKSLHTVNSNVMAEGHSDHGLLLTRCINYF